MSERTRNAVFYAIMGIAVVLAVITLLPGDSKKTNDLGYHSICPFAPWSALALLAVGALAWVIRQYGFTKED